MNNNAHKIIEIVDGVNVVLDVTDKIGSYILKADAVTLSSNWTLTTTGTLVKGYSCDILYIGPNLDLNGNTVTILGTTMSSVLDLANTLLIKAYYNGSSWEVQSYISLDSTSYVKSDSIIDGSITNNKIASQAVAEVNLKSGSVAGQIYIDSGTELLLKTLSGDLTNDANGVMTIGNNKVTASKVEASLRTELITVIVTFINKATIPIRIPYACNVVGINHTCINNFSALGSDIIKLQNNAGTDMTGGSYSLSGDIPAGSQSARNVVTGNNAIASGTNIQCVTSGSATTGMFILQIEIERV